MLVTTILYSLAVLGGVHATCPPSASKCALFNSGLTPRASFARLVDVLYNKRDIQGIRPYLNPTYIQHEQFQPDGVDAVIQELVDQKFAQGTIGYQTIIAPCNGYDRAMIHYSFKPPGVPVTLSVIDVFRFEGPCVAEHWNVNFALAPNATSSHPLFDDYLAAKAVVPSCSGD